MCSPKRGSGEGDEGLLWSRLSRQVPRSGLHRHVLMKDDGGGGRGSSHGGSCWLQDVCACWMLKKQACRRIEVGEERR
jgi:hypothetical protein